jgi:hypothetical protein
MMMSIGFPRICLALGTAALFELEMACGSGSECEGPGRAGDCEGKGGHFARQRPNAAIVDLNLELDHQVQFAL